MRIAPLILIGLLAGCGSGGSDNSAPESQASEAANQPSAQPSPVVQSEAVIAPFTATLETAPDGSDNSSIRHTARFSVRGSSIENVELLPANEYLPILGRFTISADKTLAWLDFDTTEWPNGVLVARVVAFDKPAGGSNAREIVVMPARTWNLWNEPNDAERIPPVSVMPRVCIDFNHLPYVDPAPLEQLAQMDDVTFESTLRLYWPDVEFALRRYVPAHAHFCTRTSKILDGNFISCMTDHRPDMCRSTVNSLLILMRSKRP